MDLHKWLGLLCEQTDAFDTEKEKEILMNHGNISLTVSPMHNNFL